MFIIGEASIHEEVAHEKFACDLNSCKGACCTLPGGRGAPVLDDEVAELRASAPAARKYLSARHLGIIDEIGFVEGKAGSYATTCVDDRDCVFVFYEEGVARCSIEKAFFAGESSWQKPISCHLFPLRVSRGSSTVVRYEQISECRPGRENGRTLHIPLYDSLKHALVRSFGAAWYEEFRAECIRREQMLTTR